MAAFEPGQAKNKLFGPHHMYLAPGLELLQTATNLVSDK